MLKNNFKKKYNLTDHKLKEIMSQGKKLVEFNKSKIMNDEVEVSEKIIIADKTVIDLLENQMEYIKESIDMHLYKNPVDLFLDMTKKGWSLYYREADYELYGVDLTIEQILIEVTGDEIDSDILRDMNKGKRKKDFPYKYTITQIYGDIVIIYSKLDLKNINTGFYDFALGEIGLINCKKGVCITDMKQDYTYNSNL